MPIVEVGLGGEVEVGVGGMVERGWQAGSLEPGGKTQTAPLTVTVCAAGSDVVESLNPLLVAAPKSSPSGVGPLG